MFVILVLERQQKIIELVTQQKSVRVTELSKIFNVTEETIRRDLEKLELKKKLLRSHGGAVQVGEGVESPYFEREITNVAEKKEIAQKAVEKINEGEKIVLDASSTAWYMAKVFPNKAVTVLTNSMRVIMELSYKNKVSVMSTGGTLLPESLSFVGPTANSSLYSYHVDKTFISCEGLHLEKGLSDSNEQQAQIKRRMIDISDTVYLMIDHSKIGSQSFAFINQMHVIDKIITDSKVEKNKLTEFKDIPLQLIQA